MIVERFLDSFWQLSVAISPYLFLGIIAAGLLHEIIPTTTIKKHLGDKSFLSVLKATLLGVPLPVCSCGVIPLASSIKKSGASKGATLSFLISTPETGVDSIFATYGIFGWIFTIYKVISAIIISLVAGLLVNLFDKDEKREEGAEKSSDCCSTSSCCNKDNKEEFQERKKFSFVGVFKYMVMLFRDIAKPLFFGLIIGALVTTLMPDNLESILKEYGWLSYALALIIGLPMYVCATASLPIAAALMLSGVSAGAAFVFLTAGPATNTVTMVFVKKLLGGKTLSIYLLTIALGSILFGLLLDAILGKNGINPSSLVHIHTEEMVFGTIGAIVLLSLLVFNFLYNLYAKTYKSGSCCQ